MNTKRKDQLLIHLLVKSVNNKDIPVDIPQWSIDLKINPMDLRLLLNHLSINKELKLWEDNNIQYVNLFA